MRRVEVDGVKISRLCMGTVNFGYKVAKREAFRLIDAYCEQGGNLLDTASVYCRWIDGTNGSERLIGQYLKERGKDRVMVATKGGHYDFSAPQVSRVRAEEVRKDVEQSLRTLGLERIDFYWLHRDDPALPMEELLGFCEDLKEQGKIARYGASNFSAERLEEARRVSAKRGYAGFFGVSNAFSCAVQVPNAASDPTLHSVDARQAEWFREHAVDLFAYSSCAQGYFSARAEKGEAFAREKYAAYDHPENDRRFELLTKISRETGCPIAGCAIAALLAMPFPVFPVFSVSGEEHLQELLQGESFAFEQGTFDALRLGKEY